MREAGGRVRIFVALVVALGSLAVAPSASAATTRTWVGSTDGLWSTPANWSPTGVPQNGDSVVLPGDSSSTFDVPGLQLASLSSSGGVELQATTVVSAPGAGELTIAGGVTGDDLRLPALHLPAGSHTITSPIASGFVRIDAVSGPGQLITDGAGTVTLFETAQLTGPIEARGALLDSVGLGSTSAGLSIEAGSHVIVAGSYSTPADVDEPITALAGAGPAVLEARYGTVARFSGPVTLQGDLSLEFPGCCINQIASAISGPGALGLTGSATLTGVSGYTGGTTISGFFTGRSGSPFGSGPIEVVAPGRLTLSGVSQLENDIEHDTTGVTFQDCCIQPFLVVEGTTSVDGAVTITGDGDAYIDIGRYTAPSPEVASNLVLTGGITSTAELGIRNNGPFDGTVAISGPTSLPALAVVNSLDVEVAPTVGAGTIGTASVSGAPAVGRPGATLNLRASGQHQASTAFDIQGGTLDLWGTEQRASEVSLDTEGTLYLGVIDGVLDASQLRSTGPFVQQPQSEVTFVFGAAGNDVISAPQVSLGGGDFTFFHDGTAAVGQVFPVIDNTGQGSVQGTWNGAPEGSEWFAGPQLFRLSYVGGDGNDVTFTRRPGLYSTWGFDDTIEHGGSIIGAPTLSSWGEGRVDAWTVGRDRAVWHRFSQAGVGAAWESLGGISLSTPAGVSQQVGEADVFVRGGDNALWMRSYRGGWGGWTSLGGIITDSPSVTSPSPGNLIVAARGQDGAIWIRRMVDDVWHGWTSLGGLTTSTPMVADWGDGRYDVFVRGNDGGLWQQPVIDGAPAGWIDHGGYITDSPAVAASEPGQFAIFVRGGDGNMWHRSWEGAGWSDWEGYGLPIGQRPAAVGVAPGHLELGWRSPNGSLWTAHGTQSWVDSASVATAGMIADPSDRGGFASEPFAGRGPRS